jgi:hypothetical protein
VAGRADLPETETPMEVRPIYHRHDATSKGHNVASFSVLRLEVDLQQRFHGRDVQVSWPDLMLDLGQVQLVTSDLTGVVPNAKTLFIRLNLLIIIIYF